MFGCIGKAKHPFYFKDDEYELFTCPHKISRESRLYEYLKAFTWLEAYGKLPYGELCDLSDRFITAIEVIRAEIKTIDKEKSKEAETKRKNASRRR